MGQLFLIPVTRRHVDGRAFYTPLLAASLAKDRVFFPQTDDMLRKRKQKPRKNLNILFLSLSFLGLSRFPVRNRIYARDERTCRYRHRRRCRAHPSFSPRSSGAENPARCIRRRCRDSLQFWFLVLDSGPPPSDGAPIKMETNEVGRNEVLR